MKEMLDFFKEGGSAMWPILGCSLWGISIIIERAYFLLYRSRVNARRFMDVMVKYINAGLYDQALKICTDSTAPLPKICKVILLKHKESERSIQDAVDEVALVEIPLLNKRTHYLGMLANTSTLLGLLGTIFGLISAFKAVAIASAAQKAMFLAKGISVAMNTTAFGLCVGIPCLVFYSIFQGYTEKIINDIDECSVKLINLIILRQR
ncbi:MAG: MotA/TolQ/ExbB proton channel family protein [bacterium]